MLRKRAIMGTIYDILKNVAQIVHTYHRSVANFLVNLMVDIAIYYFYDTKPEINIDFNLIGANKASDFPLNHPSPKTEKMPS